MPAVTSASVSAPGENSPVFGSERKASDGSAAVPNGIIRLFVTVILPLESIVILAVPLVDAEIVSASGKNIPVFESPDGVIAGSAEVPADTVLTPDTTILVALAAPNTGVTKVGLVANTLAPEPVSSVSAADRLADVKEPNDVVVLLDVIAPVRFGILVLRLPFQ